MLDPVPRAISLENSFHHGVFRGRVFQIGDRLIRAQEFYFVGHPQDVEQFAEVIAGDRGFHLLDRSHRNRLDFGLDRVQGSVFDECVAGSELEVS